MKNKTRQSSFNKPFVKFLSAIFAAFTIPIIFGVFDYISKDFNDFISNFGYEFTIVLIINLTFISFIILPLSLLLDRLIVLKLNNYRGLENLIKVLSYFIVGLISGFIYSFFIGSFSLESVFYGVELTFIFVTYQLVFNWIVNKIKKKVIVV
jgi:hypothetical protein